MTTNADNRGATEEVSSDEWLSDVVRAARETVRRFDEFGAAEPAPDAEDYWLAASHAWTEKLYAVPRSAGDSEMAAARVIAAFADRVAYEDTGDADGGHGTCGFDPEWVLFCHECRVILRRQGDHAPLWRL